MFLFRRLQSQGLFHVCGFIIGQDAMEESSLNVEMLESQLRVGAR